MKLCHDNEEEGTKANCEKPFDPSTRTGYSYALLEKYNVNLKNSPSVTETSKPVRVMICSYLHSFWVENWGIPKSAYEKGRSGPFLQEFVKFSQRLKRGRVSKQEYYTLEQKRVGRMIVTIQMMQKHNIDIINLSEASSLIVTKLVELGWVTDIRDGESPIDAIVSQPNLLSSDNQGLDASGVTAIPPKDRVGTCILQMKI